MRRRLNPIIKQMYYPGVFGYCVYCGNPRQGARAGRYCARKRCTRLRVRETMRDHRAENTWVDRRSRMWYAVARRLMMLGFTKTEIWQRWRPMFDRIVPRQEDERAVA